MGRNKLYNEETINVNFKVPTSKVSEFKKKAKLILLSYIFDSEIPNSVKLEPSIQHVIAAATKHIESAGFVIGKKCGCYLDESNLFRRDKNCKVSKDKHKFI